MTRRRLLLALVVPLLVASCDRDAARANRLSFSLQSDTGETVSLTDARFAGKVVIVDLWGAWCIPCHEQMPHLVRLYKDYHEEGLEIVGINFEINTPDTEEDRIARLQTFRDEYDIQFDLVTGGGMADVATVLPDVRNVKGLPVTIFIARDGRVDAVETGFIREDAERHETRVVRLLAESVD